MSLKLVNHPLAQIPEVHRAFIENSASFGDQIDSSIKYFHEQDQKNSQNITGNDKDYRSIEFIGNRPSIAPSKVGFINIHDRQDLPHQSSNINNNLSPNPTGIEFKEFTSIYSFQPSQEMISALTNYVNVSDQAYPNDGNQPQRSSASDTNAQLMVSQQFQFEQSYKNSTEVPMEDGNNYKHTAQNENFTLLQIPSKESQGRKRHFSEGLVPQNYEIEAIQQPARLFTQYIRGDIQQDMPIIQEETGQGSQTQRERETEVRDLKRLVEDIESKPSRDPRSIELLNVQLMAEEQEIRDLRLRINEILQSESKSVQFKSADVGEYSDHKYETQHHNIEYKSPEQPE